MLTLYGWKPTTNGDDTSPSFPTLRKSTHHLGVCKYNKKYSKDIVYEALLKILLSPRLPSLPHPYLHTRSPCFTDVLFRCPLLRLPNKSFWFNEYPRFRAPHMCSLPSFSLRPFYSTVVSPLLALVDRSLTRYSILSSQRLIPLLF